MMNYKKNIKRLSYLLLFIQLSSCHTRTTGYPLVFRAGNNILHNEIIFELASHVMTEYSSGAMLYVASTWTMNGDTIFTVPKIEYGISRGEFWYTPIDGSDSTVTSIKKTYILKGNILEDITDYSPIFSSLGLIHTVDSTRTIEYYRIK